jgi:hypothetical protein
MSIVLQVDNEKRQNRIHPSIAAAGSGKEARNEPRTQGVDPGTAYAAQHRELCHDWGGEFAQASTVAYAYTFR